MTECGYRVQLSKGRLRLTSEEDERKQYPNGAPAAVLQAFWQARSWLGDPSERDAAAVKAEQYMERIKSENPMLWLTLNHSSPHL